jgi:hypothetical protein
MANEGVRPFLAAQRRDLLQNLAQGQRESVHQGIVSTVGRAFDVDKPKLDGKAGGLDGAAAASFIGDEAAFVPLCGAYQPGWPPINHPKGKEEKEGKEQKDGKESKEGKDAKDGKEGKEGKESKEGKEGKEGKESKDGKEGKEGKESKDGKEDKDTSDGFKFGGDEAQDPFSRFGDPQELPWESFNAIAATHSERIQGLLQQTALF